MRGGNWADLVPAAVVRVLSLRFLLDGRVEDRVEDGGEELEEVLVGDPQFFCCPLDLPGEVVVDLEAPFAEEHLEELLGQLELLLRLHLRLLFRGTVILRTLVVDIIESLDNTISIAEKHKFVK